MRPPITRTTVDSYATGLMPPKHLGRIHPKEFLDGCRFIAKVVVCSKDSDGCETPEAARYSKVKCLKRRVAGTPPRLTMRGSR